MKVFRKIADNPVYNLIMNILILVSVGYIIAEKFIYLGALPYRILLNIDLLIICLFAVDFLLRFLADGFHYFFKDYGWIDFLAAVPLLTPAIKILRFLRLLRSVRMIRILRILKILKSKRAGFSPITQRVILPVSSLIMLMMIAFSSILIVNYTLINRKLDESREDSLLEQSSKLAAMEDRIHFLKGKEIISDVIRSSETEKLNGYSRSLFRQGDLQIRKSGSLYVVFSRLESARRISRFEGLLYILAFLVTAALISAILLILEKNVIQPLKSLTIRLELLSGETIDSKDSSDELERLKRVIDRMSNK